VYTNENGINRNRLPRRSKTNNNNREAVKRNGTAYGSKAAKYTRLKQTKTLPQTKNVRTLNPSWKYVNVRE